PRAKSRAEVSARDDERNASVARASRLPCHASRVTHPNTGNHTSRKNRPGNFRDGASIAVRCSRRDARNGRQDALATPADQLSRFHFLHRRAVLAEIPRAKRRAEVSAKHLCGNDTLSPSSATRWLWRSCWDDSQSRLGMSRGRASFGSPKGKAVAHAMSRPRHLLLIRTRENNRTVGFDDEGRERREVPQCLSMLRVLSV